MTTSSKTRKFPHAFIAFESTPFRWLMGSHVAFFLAMQGQLLVRSLLAWELTESELSLAYVNLAIAVPMIFGSLFGGAVIDRVERKKLVMFSQVVILANELLVLGLLLSGHLDFWHLLATSFVMGVMFPFIMPTRTAMLYSLVGRDHLSNAMALQAGAMNLARVLGPAIIGLLIPVLSLQGAYITAISLYVISTVCMLKLPACHPESRTKKPLLEDMAYSFSYIGKHRDILLCLVFGLFPMLLAMPVISFLVVFADDVWQTGESGLGMLMAMLGAGGIIGTMWVARMGDNIKRTRLMITTALIFAVVLAAFSVSKYFALGLALLLIANIFSNISQTLNQIIIQLRTADEVRGRMSSLVMLSLGLTPLGVLPIAFASEAYGISVTIFAACVLLGFIVLAFLLFSPTLKNLDEVMALAAKEDAVKE